MEAARPATADDLDSIVNVAERVRAEQHGARGAALFAVREGGLWPPRGRLTAAVEAEDTIVVVGTYDDVVFGYGVAVIEPLLDGGLLGDLKDFAVEPDARSVGIGEAMMNELVDRLRARGCIGIDSRALPGDRATKNFFESFGLKARLLTVHRSLLDDD